MLTAIGIDGDRRVVAVDMAETDGGAADRHQHVRLKTLEIGGVELLEGRGDDVHKIVLPEGGANVPHCHVDPRELPGAVVTAHHDASGRSLMNALWQQIVHDHNVAGNTWKLGDEKSAEPLLCVCVRGRASTHKHANH